jgi:hypothetical protein
VSSLDEIKPDLRASIVSMALPKQGSNFDLAETFETDSLSVYFFTIPPVGYFCYFNIPSLFDFFRLKHAYSLKVTFCG